ncbi:TetR/AcrR family transcriptional regulator [Radiobacillus sp. PE A8.2]|uniref:TetR/AcrR family transcriptional regulator n=1 Tax=Radiobacillus sp. PE A8.2 TaxID=3380349 RepID=UPI003890AB48
MDGFERRKQIKKNSILKTALDLFMMYGVQKVSIAQIAMDASVSQVTIYNYFESKHNLVHEVIIYYVETVWSEIEQVLDSTVAFPEKIKLLVFNKKQSADQINEGFYHEFMKDYAAGNSYIEEFYAKKVFPKLIALFDEGREKGYIDASISNEAILFYIQMLKESMQKEDVYQQILPYTEDITKLIFYGIVGNKEK